MSLTHPDKVFNMELTDKQIEQLRADVRVVVELFGGNEDCINNLPIIDILNMLECLGFNVDGYK